MAYYGLLWPTMAPWIPQISIFRLKKKSYWGKFESTDRGIITRVPRMVFVRVKRAWRDGHQIEIVELGTVWVHNDHWGVRITPNISNIFVHLYLCICVFVYLYLCNCTGLGSVWMYPAQQASTHLTSEDSTQYLLIWSQGALLQKPVTPHHVSKSAPENGSIPVQ